MDDKALESWEKPEVSYFTPPLHDDVIIAGRKVPHLTSQRIMNEFEGFRFAVGHHVIDCNIEDADHLARMLAHSIAVGAGYVGWPEEDEDFVKEPFAYRVHFITGLDGEDSAHV